MILLKLFSVVQRKIIDSSFPLGRGEFGWRGGREIVRARQLQRR
jgi:hypothetical protein